MEAKPVGAIPGWVEGIFYRRGGRHQGRYAHLFRSHPRMLAMSDGSLWIRDAGNELWLENPKGGRGTVKHKKKHHHKKYSKNQLGELLAAWNPRRGGHRRRHRYSGDAVTMALQHPADFALQAGTGMLSAYGVVTVGNLMATFVPIQQAGWTGTLVRTGTRGLAAWGLDQFVWPMFGPANREAARVGALIGLGGSLILELLGQSFTLGVGDHFQMPGRIFGLGGAGGYARIPLRGSEGAGAYARIPLRGISMVQDRTAQNNTWMA